MMKMFRLLAPLVACLVLSALPLATYAQTGQSLIANPLLSSAKVKEVKRQIAEAAHRDPAAGQAAPPPAAAPAPVLAQVPDHLLGQMRQGQFNPGGQSNSDAAKSAMARLQVMAVVGKAAFLGKVSQANPDPGSIQGMPGMGGIPQQMAGIQQPVGAVMASAPPANSMPRRTSSVLIRDHEPIYIEGYDVIPTIHGDSVRLALVSAPHETIFQASVQATSQSPSTVPPNGSLEKPSSEYANSVSPDATSMTQGANGLSGQVQNPLQGQAQQRQRPPVTSEGF